MNGVIPIKKLAHALFYLNFFLVLSPEAFCLEADSELSDWISEPGSQNVCHGYYRPFIGAVVPNDAWDLPIELSADDTEFTLNGQSRLIGHVALKQGNQSLHADEITIIRSPEDLWESITAHGHIHYFTPEISLWGKQATYFHTRRYFHFEHAKYHWYERHARGQARTINIDKDANVYLYQASYTTCAPQIDTWELKAKEIVLYPKKGRASAKHVYLNMHDVPIFYFPFINYPIDNKRHSGFLFPSYGSSSNSGNEISIPYYWNIAPNYDLTLTERLLTERGLETQSKFRYLLKNSEGFMVWHILPADRKYEDFQKKNLLSPPGGLSFLDPRIVALKGSDTRQAFNYHHSSHWGRQWLFNVNFNYVSDDNYFVDLGNDINTASTIFLPQQANLTYYGDHWSHYFNVEEYQVLQPLSKPITDEIYKRQPQWVFQAIYPNVGSHLTFGLNGELVNFAHRPDLVTLAPLTTGQRYHLRPSISVPFEESWYFFRPRAQLDWLQYGLKLGEDATTQNLAHNPSRSIPMYDVDSGLIFTRQVTHSRFEFTQTFEPRLYYLYVPYRDQHIYPNFDSGVINFSYAQLFRDNRFSGRDRVGDANQLSVSLMSRFLPYQGGQEMLRASIGEIFYFSDHHVFLCEELGQENSCYLLEDATATQHHSNLLGEIAVHFNQSLSSSLFWEWDSKYRYTEQAALTLYYQPSENKIFNINYYWLKHDLGQTDFTTGQIGSLNQIEFSLLWPIHLRWQLLSLWRYNFQQHQTVELLGGLEYNGCCVALQLVASRYRQSNNYFYPQAYATGVFAQLVFKGLSAVGLNNPDGKLKQKIPGYISLAERQHWVTPASRNSIPTTEIPLY